jgi:hypothetical protein
MRAAPAFEVDVTPGRSERAVLAAIGGFCAALLAAWVLSHVGAAAGPTAGDMRSWLGVGLGAALGFLLGWLHAPRSPVVLVWQQGQWWLRRPAAPGRAGTVQAKLDCGSWLLLCFRPAAGGPATWLGVGQRSAGPAWHALRATLFAPGVAAQEHGSREDARS